MHLVAPVLAGASVFLAGGLLGATWMHQQQQHRSRINTVTFQDMIGCEHTVARSLYDESLLEAFAFHSSPVNDIRQYYGKRIHAALCSDAPDACSKLGLLMLAEQAAIDQSIKTGPASRQDSPSCQSPNAEIAEYPGGAFTNGA